MTEGCEYCTNEKEIEHDEVCLYVLKPKLQSKAKLQVEINDHYRGWEVKGVIQINYCPMCGKKLTKEE
jgi:hypothetical protein